MNRSQGGDGCGDLYDLLGGLPGGSATPGASALTRQLLDRLDEIDPPRTTDRPTTAERLEESDVRGDY